MAGAPKGNSNAARGKEWRDAIRKVLKQYENKEAGIERGMALRKIAERVVEQALIGNKDAWNEIGNRLDGKPSQSIDVGFSEKPIEELTDAELAARIAELSARISGKENSKTEPPNLH